MSHPKPSSAAPTPRENDAASRQRHALMLGAIMLSLFGLTVLIWWQSLPNSVKKMRADEDLDLALEVVNPGYLGMDTCAECHKQRVEQFRETRHAKACVTAAHATGFVPGKHICSTRDPNLRFEMTRKGDNLVATTIKTTPHGEQDESYPIA